MTGAKINFAALLIFFGLLPLDAQAFGGSVSCDDVRRLSRAEQDYWSAKLNLSAEQRHQIYVTCYVNYRGRDDVSPFTNAQK